MRAIRHSLPAGALILMASISGAAPAATIPSATTRPNIILILTDDLDTATMAYLPRLKSMLADEGTTFSNFLVSDSLCCPSRSSILRGQYDHNHHVRSNDPPDGGFQKFHDLGNESSTIATWLHSAGYTTILLGKYLNGYPESVDSAYVPPGWDEWASPISGKPYSQYDYTLNENGNRTESRGHGASDYLDDVLSAGAAGLISRQAGTGNPFFLYLAPYTPHRPFTPPPRYETSFAGATAPRPPSFNEEDMSDKPSSLRNLPLISAAEIEGMDNVWRKRLSSMLAIEDMVSSVIGALSSTGQLDNTYILFTSDNGYHLGEHRLLPGKQTPYEEDIRVPLIVRGPGVPAGAVLPHLVGNVDLAPTIAELAGIGVPPFVDGLSFVRLLRPNPPDPAAFRDAFLLEHADPGDAVSGGASQGTLEPQDPTRTATTSDRRGQNLPGFTGIRTLTTLYVQYSTGDREMYDLKADPFELNNIASTADPAIVASLSTRLRLLRRCAGAGCR